jgi:hypothetical protein
MFFLLYLLMIIFTLPMGLAFWTLGLGIPGANFIDAWINNLHSYFLLFWIPTISTADITVILTVFFVLSIPIFILTEWVLIGVYGLSRDVVTSGATSGKGAFYWFKQNVSTFLGTGIVKATIILGPLGIITYLLDLYYGYSIPCQLVWPILSFAVIYVYATLGVLKLYSPAVVDELGVTKSLKKSLRLIKFNFVRVFASWTIYFALLISWFLPLVIWGTTQGFLGPLPSYNSVGFWFSAILAVAGFLLDVLIFFPVMILGMTKIYHDFSKEQRFIEKGEKTFEQSCVV